MLTFIVAIAENNVIGKDNKLIWHLPADLKFFKQTTLGHPIVMGRKTFDSIGKPLPGRRNIVLTRNRDFQHNGVEVYYSPEELMNHLSDKEEVFVIGGAEVFRLLYPYTQKMVITRVHQSFEGDIFFPEFDMTGWKKTWSEKHSSDEKNPFDYTFEIYERNS
jgi:dihydrofolate reductase